MSNQVPPVRRSRVRQQAKRKRKDRILDILIGVVFVAILIVGWNILFGGGDSRKETASGNRDKPELFENKDDGQKKNRPGTLRKGGKIQKKRMDNSRIPVKRIQMRLRKEIRNGENHPEPVTALWRNHLLTRMCCRQ